MKVGTKVEVIWKDHHCFGMKGIVENICAVKIVDKIYFLSPEHLKEIK